MFTLLEFAVGAVALAAFVFLVIIPAWRRVTRPKGTPDGHS